MIGPLGWSRRPSYSRRAPLSAYQVSLLTAIASGFLGYFAMSLPPLDFGGDGHACMGDGSEACVPPSFLFAWIVHSVMVGIVLLPFALLHGERHGRSAATWSLIAISSLPATLIAMILGSSIAEVDELSLSFFVGAGFLAGIPLVLFGTAILLSARSILRGGSAEVSRPIPALVAVGYAYIAAETTFLFGLPLPD